MNSNMYIKGTLFQDTLNTAISVSSVTLQNQTFKERPVMTESFLELSDSNFIRCRQQVLDLDSSEGGALALRGVIADITRCLFRQCQVRENGGAVRVSSSAKLSLTECLFTENSAILFSAALSLYNVYDGKVAHCNFTQNVCQGMCSALSVAHSDKVVLSENNFYDNKAASMGAVYLETSSVVADNLIFAKNKASVCSAMYVGAGADITLTDSAMSDDNRTSIAVDGDLSVEKSSFGGDEKNEVAVKKGVFNHKECNFNQMTELVIEALPPLEAEADEFDNMNDQAIPGFLPQVPEDPQQVHVDTVESGFLDKSTFMIIAYTVVIGLLILGLKMYLSTTSSAETAQNDNSIFVDEDFDNAQQAAFMQTATHSAGPTASHVLQPEMDKVGKDVPLETELSGL